MKVLMVGLGSVGQRHVRNIRKIYGDDIELIAYRVRGLKRTFSDAMQVRENIDLEKEYGIKSYSSLDDALECEKPDVTFITNITSSHVDCAIKAARFGSHIFIEKPLSNSMEKLDQLHNIIQSQNLIAFVGFQNRYHPCLKKLKNLVESKTIGDIVSVYIENGERLSTMHDYEDYKNTYMARKDMGGGLVLNLTIHEIDYINWIFGEPKVLSVVSSEKVDPEIDVEDNFIALMQSNLKGRTIPICLKSDFYQYPAKRCCRVVGTKGSVEVDLLSCEMNLIVDGAEDTVKFDDFVRNDMFIDELRSFFSSVCNGEQNMIDFEEGMKSMRVALNIKAAIEKDFC